MGIMGIIGTIGTFGAICVVICDDILYCGGANREASTFIENILFINLYI
jgi:hypothetical protein